MKNRFFILACLVCVSCVKIGAQADYFYPNAGSFNPKIPTPEQFLGYPIGSHHTRYDRIVSYFQELDRLSDRMTLGIYRRNV